MTRVVDKRNVCIVAKGNDASDAKITLIKREKDLSQLIYGKYDDGIEIEAGAVVNRLTTPDMIAVVGTSYPAGNANVKAHFNGVEVPATDVVMGGDTYKLWGLKSQDFAVFDFSGATT